MIYALLAYISSLIILVISRLGYTGIVLAMALESACIPLPSEVIMPFSGYLVQQGRFSFWGVSVAGALGCALGSALAYWAGSRGGRPLLQRYGHYLLITEHEIAWADRWFARHGEWATLVSRLLPVIRTFISLPAGIARMPFGRFLLYAFVGSLPWSAALAYAGVLLGEHWERIGGLLHRFDLAIGVLLLAGAGWFFWSRWTGRVHPVTEQS